MPVGLCLVAKFGCKTFTQGNDFNLGNTRRSDFLD